MFTPVTERITWPPWGTQLGDTLTIEAFEAFTAKPNWKMVQPPVPLLMLRSAVMPPTLAFGLMVMLTVALLAEVTVIEFTVISPVKSATTGSVAGCV